jgi:predicted nucleic acid-binding Zn ribbon protein
MLRKRSRTARGSPEPVSSAIDSLAAQLGITRTLRQYNVITSWETIVGEQIAKVTKAEYVQNGVLFVSVATAPWRAELTMRRKEILEKISAAINKGVVKDIRFR